MGNSHSPPKEMRVVVITHDMDVSDIYVCGAVSSQTGTGVIEDLDSLFSAREEIRFW